MRNKLIIGGVIALILLAVITFGRREPNAGGGFGERTCTASTTVWTVGPGNSIEVLPLRYNRAAFSLSNINNSVALFYRLDGTDATTANGVPLSATSTHHYEDSYPVRGTVEVRGGAASSSVIVTECIYS